MKKKVLKKSAFNENIQINSRIYNGKLHIMNWMLSSSVCSIAVNDSISFFAASLNTTVHNAGVCTQRKYFMLSMQNY